MNILKNENQSNLEQKNKEIDEYKKVLENYRKKNGQGRWYNLGCRRLEELEKEKQQLEKQENVWKKNLKMKDEIKNEYEEDIFLSFLDAVWDEKIDLVKKYLPLVDVKEKESLALIYASDKKNSYLFMLLYPLSIPEQALKKGKIHNQKYNDNFDLQMLEEAISWEQYEKINQSLSCDLLKKNIVHKKKI